MKFFIDTANIEEIKAKLKSVVIYVDWQTRYIDCLLNVPSLQRGYPVNRGYEKHREDKDPHQGEEDYFDCAFYVS